MSEDTIEENNSFEYSVHDLQITVPSDTYCAKLDPSYFDQCLQERWEKARSSNVLNYYLDKLETRIVKGKFGFVAQLNVNRVEKRRKPQEMNSVDQPFNKDLFNFTNIKSNEVVFELSNSNSQNGAATPTPNGVSDRKIHLLVVNVSPLEYCNSLFVPYVNQCQPQVLTAESISLAIELMLLSKTPSLRVAFNGLCAYASVNHHHFHVYYLQHTLYIEHAKLNQIKGPVYEFLEYPAKAFVFVLTSIEDLPSLSKDVFKLSNYLWEQNIAQNLVITRGYAHRPDTETKAGNAGSYDAVRVILWARKSQFGVKDDTKFYMACCELGGHLTMKNNEAYENVTEEYVAQLMDDTCSDQFALVRQKVFHLF